MKLDGFLTKELISYVNSPVGSQVILSVVFWILYYLQIPFRGNTFVSSMYTRREVRLNGWVWVLNMYFCLCVCLWYPFFFLFFSTFSVSYLYIDMHVGKSAFVFMSMRACWSAYVYVYNVYANSFFKNFLKKKIEHNNDYI